MITCPVCKNPGGVPLFYSVAPCQRCANNPALPPNLSDPAGLVNDDIGVWLQRNPLIVVRYRVFDNRMGCYNGGDQSSARCYLDPSESQIGYLWEDEPAKVAKYLWRHEKVEEFFSPAHFTFECLGVCADQTISP